MATTPVNPTGRKVRPGRQTSHRGSHHRRELDHLCSGVNQLSLNSNSVMCTTVGSNGTRVPNYASVVASGRTAISRPLQQSTPIRPLGNAGNSGYSHYTSANGSSAVESTTPRTPGIIPIIRPPSLPTNSRPTKPAKSHFQSVNKFHGSVVLSLEDFTQPSTPPPPKSSAVVKPQRNMTPKLGIVNESQRIGKVRETPKPKRPSRLKRALFEERKLRTLRRCQSAPPSSGTNMDMDSRLSNFSVNPEQDQLVVSLMKRLSDLQDRSFVKYADSPHHQKRLKRYVCGLREVVKHLELKRVRMLLVARNLEDGAIRRFRELQAISDPTTCSTQGFSALEQILVQIWILALRSEPITPILVTQNRHKLATLCHKPGRVSVVGILSVAGAEEVAKQLLSLRTAINIGFRGSCHSLNGDSAA